MDILKLLTACGWLDDLLYGRKDNLVEAVNRLCMGSTFEQHTTFTTTTPVCICLNALTLELLVTPSADSSLTRAIHVYTIRDVRWGFSELFPKSHALKQILQKDEKRIFSIVYGDGFGSLEYLNLSCSKQETSNIWVWAFQLILHAIRIQPSTFHMNLLQIYGKAIQRAEGKLPSAVQVVQSISDCCEQQASETISKLRSIYIDEEVRFASPRMVAKLQKIITQDVLLEFADFKILFNYVMTMGPMSKITDLYYDIACDSNPMSIFQFEEFITQTQGENLDPDEVRNMVRELAELELEVNAEGAFINPVDFDEDVVYIEWFTEYFLSIYGSGVYFSDKASEVMSLPLSRYFISSSHNTYLHRKQRKDDANLEMYIQTLLLSCRSLELDCWDSDDGKSIIVTHALDMIVKTQILSSTVLDFQQVLEVIRDYAFVSSPYPLFLSIENHVSMELQVVMASLFKEVLGPYLLTEYLNESETDLPSPEALQHKILIKNKKIGPRADPSDSSLSRDLRPPDSSASKMKESQHSDLGEGEPSKADGENILSIFVNRFSKRRRSQTPESNTPARRDSPSIVAPLSNRNSESRPVTVSTSPPQELPGAILSISPPHAYDLNVSRRSEESLRSNRLSAVSQLSEYMADPVTFLSASRAEEGSTRQTTPRQSRTLYKSLRDSMSDIPTFETLQPALSPRQRSYTVSSAATLDAEAANFPPSSRHSIATAVGSSLRPRCGSIGSRTTENDLTPNPRLSFQRSFADRIKQRYHADKTRAPVAQELSDMILYTRSYKLTELQHWDLYSFKLPVIYFCQIGSISEFSAGALIIKRPTDFAAHNVEQLTRVFPSFRKENSENYSPFPMWAVGIQSVALNFQTSCVHMMANQAMFSRNGFSGYRLKPLALQSFEQMRHALINPPQLVCKLQVSILHASHHSPFNTPFVQIEIIGAGVEGLVQTTLAVNAKNSKFVHWNHTFNFEIRNQDLAMIRFTISDRRQDKRASVVSLGHVTIPLDSLRRGYRHLSLQNAFGTSVTYPRLGIFTVREEIDESNLLGVPKRSHRSLSPHKMGKSSSLRSRTTSPERKRLSITQLSHAFILIGYDHDTAHTLKISLKTTVNMAIARFLNLTYESQNPSELCLVFVPSSGSRNILLSNSEDLDRFVLTHQAGLFHVRAAALTKLLPSGEIDPAEFDTFYEIKSYENSTSEFNSPVGQSSGLKAEKKFKDLFSFGLRKSQKKKDLGRVMAIGAHSIAILAMQNTKTEDIRSIGDIATVQEEATTSIRLTFKDGYHLICEPASANKIPAIITLLQSRMDAVKPVAQPLVDPVSVQQKQCEDMFVSLLENVLLEFPKDVTVDPSRYVQVFVGLSEEPVFRDIDCPCFYTRDDIPLHVLCHRLGQCIYHWGETHNVAVSTELKLVYSTLEDLSFKQFQKDETISALRNLVPDDAFCVVLIADELLKRAKLREAVTAPRLSASGASTPSLSASNSMTFDDAMIMENKTPESPTNNLSFDFPRTFLAPHKPLVAIVEADEEEERPQLKQIGRALSHAKGAAILAAKDHERSPSRPSSRVNSRQTSSFNLLPTTAEPRPVSGTAEPDESNLPKPPLLRPRSKLNVFESSRRKMLPRKPSRVAITMSVFSALDRTTTWAQRVEELDQKQRNSSLSPLEMRELPLATEIHALLRQLQVQGLVAMNGGEMSDEVRPLEAQILDLEHQVAALGGEIDATQPIGTDRKNHVSKGSAVQETDL